MRLWYSFRLEIKDLNIEMRQIRKYQWLTRYHPIDTGKPSWWLLKQSKLLIRTGCRRYYGLKRYRKEWWVLSLRKIQPSPWTINIMVHTGHGTSVEVGDIWNSLMVSCEGYIYGDSFDIGTLGTCPNRFNKSINHQLVQVVDEYWVFIDLVRRWPTISSVFV